MNKLGIHLAAAAVAVGLTVGLTATADAGSRGYKAKRAHVAYAGYDRDYGYRWGRRGTRGDVVVDAPFTSVETGRYGRTDVDAPFTSVRVGRMGVWVRAPFVDIYVPR